MSRNGSTPSSGQLSPTQDRRSRRLAGPRDVLLRGGRLTKIAGAIASYAPALGRSGPALALPLPFLTLGVAAFLGGIGFSGVGVSEAQAQVAAACTKSGSTYVCTGSTTVFDTASGTFPSPTASFTHSTGTLSVQLTGTNDWTSSGTAFILNSKAGVQFTSTGTAVDIVARGGDGINAVYRKQSVRRGRGVINVAGSVTASRHGIYVTRGGDVTITTAREIKGTSGIGIKGFAYLGNSADGSVGSKTNITARGKVTGG